MERIHEMRVQDIYSVERTRVLLLDKGQSQRWLYLMRPVFVEDSIALAALVCFILTSSCDVQTTDINVKSTPVRNTSKFTIGVFNFTLPGTARALVCRLWILPVVVLIRVGFGTLFARL